MSLIRHSVLLASVISISIPYSPAHAADSKGLYQTLFYIPCEKYSKDRKEPVGTGNNAVDQIYISGWLSAYNYLTPNTYDILPNHSVTSAMEWMDKFCAANPAKSVEAGLLQLSDELYPQRIQNYQPPADKAAQKPVNTPPPAAAPAAAPKQ